MKKTEENKWRIKEFRFGSITIAYPETYYYFMKECFIYDVYRTDLLNQGDVVLDLGAAVGEFAILASRKVGKNGVIIAVEPNPDDFELLEQNKVRNKCQNIIPINMGVAAMPIEKEITFWGRRFKARLDTLGSILLEHGLTKDLNFLKMDIEGYEAEVLSRDYEIIKKADIISLELHSTKNKIDNILGSNTYKFEPLTARYCIKKLLKNTLFSHPRHLLKAVVEPIANNPRLLYQMLLKNEFGFKPDNPTQPYLMTGTYIRKDSPRSSSNYRRESR